MINNTTSTYESQRVLKMLPATCEEAPSIDDSEVVWFDDRTHGAADVWGYNLASGQQFQVTNHSAAQLIADIQIAAGKWQG